MYYQINYKVFHGFMNATLFSSEQLLFELSHHNLNLRSFCFVNCLFFNFQQLCFYTKKVWIFLSFTYHQYHIYLRHNSQITTTSKALAAILLIVSQGLSRSCRYSTISRCLFLRGERFISPFMKILTSEKG